jgi:hypothetical protein
MLLANKMSPVIIEEAQVLIVEVVAMETLTKNLSNILLQKESISYTIFSYL